MTAMAISTTQLDNNGRWERPLTEQRAEKLYWDNYESVRNILKKSCNSNDADDIMADTWVRIQRNWPHYHGLTSFRNWMISIALNLLTDLFRSNAIRKAEPLVDNVLHCRNTSPSDSLAESLCGTLIDRLDSASWLTNVEKKVLFIRIEASECLGVEQAKILEMEYGYYRTVVSRVRQKFIRFVRENEEFSHLLKHIR